MNIKGEAYLQAMDFESVYDYSEYYHIKNNPTVWRYMDLDKLESLLSDKALFFAKPCAFEDPLEGSYSKYDIKNTTEIDLKISRELMRGIQEYSAISCWHMNRHESAAMWDLYLRSGDGIAIKTDYNSLIRSLNDYRYRYFSGKVQYIDFTNDMTSRNIYDTLFFKRKSFSHENEIRLLIIASRYNEWYLERKFESEGIPYEEWEGLMDKIEEESYTFSHHNGTLVSCDVDQLISKIYVSPKSSSEFVKEVKELVCEHGITDSKVIQSDLYNDYIY